MSIVNVFNFEHQSSRKWVTPTHELHQDNLICHCHDHDSRIQLHHRNERKRCQNIVKSNSSESIDKLDAKSCSKIVAICLRDANAKHNTLACMHQWSIPTQLDLKRLATNSSVFLDIAVHTFITTGKVNKENPLEPGRFAVVIKKGTASSSAASGYHHLALDCLIFAHINTHDVHFLFHRTTGMNITQPDTTEACTWVPTVLRPMLSAMSDPVYLKKVEHDIKAFQKALKD
ncbi:hypothetical protein PSTT_01776 [Puccinia striiformis]|uniref:Uncharacterized protein n=1 Tax=Puccinia striiformis TaxID=27350 RepID=A0A2S4W251_9BASI|nr:hypothetical protein PSTT_01776 [Puccinia striiformis]